MKIPYNHLKNQTKIVIIDIKSLKKNRGENKLSPNLSMSWRDIICQIGVL